MAGICSVMAAFVFLATFKVSFSEEIHMVGESSLWALGVNYSAWAKTKTFHVGDTIVFQYNSQFHNVLQVTKPNYHSCNATSPIATYNSGNDSLPVKGRGHRFFICGFPGHCDAGQKVDIRVLAVSPTSSPDLSPEASPSPPVITASPPSADLGNSNNSPSKIKLGFYQLIQFSLVVAVSSMLGL